MIITSVSLLATVGLYYFAQLINKKYASPFTSPVILTTALLIGLFAILNISYDDYYVAKEIITFFLGPATVALAIPIYRHRNILKKYLQAALVGLLGGTIATIVAALMIAQLFNLTSELKIALSLKSITVPVASEVAKIISANELHVATFVILTGLIGALIGPMTMNIFKIDNPFARGLAMGTIAHGIGTAEILKEGEIAGAVSAVAMGLAAIISALIIPLIYI